MQWLFSFIIEILYFASPGHKRLKQILGVLLLFIIIGASFLTISSINTPYIYVILLLLPFRILNISRAIKSRMHPRYLRTSTLRTEFSLIVLHALGYIITLPELITFSGLIPLFQLFIGFVILSLAVLHINKTRHISNKAHFSDKELPTVSVCIPARNETDSLEQCLRSVLANDYPKLEILVLDDCSQDKTADVIKSFAHEGVRFVQGDEPQTRWLAKNQAYQKLLTEATGEVVLYCGVDVRFGPHAIRALVTTMLNRKKSMLSVLPLRFYSKLNEAFVQPMRYWWELIPPRKLVNRPPVLSTCWLVDRKRLLGLGGFKSVSHTIIPEGVFAREFIKDNRYSFIRADKELDIRTTKPFSEQWSTAIRTNYPQIRKRPEMALILTFFTLTMLIAPFFQAVYGIFTLNLSLASISILTCIILTATHVLILAVSNPANIPIGIISLPVAVLTEIFIGYVSMFSYEFGSIEWKNRNICIPVMHTIPKKDFIGQLNQVSAKTN